MTETLTAAMQAIFRPLIALTLVGSCVGAVFTDKIATFPEWYVGLVLIVVPGYMGLRTLEKVILPKANGVPTFAAKTNGGS